MEYKKGHKKAAPFVAPRKGGITILRDGYTMKRFTPSYIAPKRPLTIDDLKKRGFGEALYTKLTPQQRQGVIMLGDLDELRAMNMRRKEAMASEVIFTNGCVMDEYVDDLHNFEEKEVRYYDGEKNPAVYTPAATLDTTETSGKRSVHGAPGARCARCDHARRNKGLDGSVHFGVLNTRTSTATHGTH